MLSLNTIHALAKALAATKPTHAQGPQMRTQWENDVLAIARAFPLTGSEPENRYRKTVFLELTGLNQSPI